MSQYQMSIDGNIELMDYSSIYDYIAIVGVNDNLVITLSDNKVENINVLCTILKDNNFVIDCNKHYNDGKYRIHAIRH